MKKMEGTKLNFKFICNLSIRCDKINQAKGSSYIKSPKRLRYKNARINPMTDDRCFQYAFALT